MEVQTVVIKEINRYKRWKIEKDIKIKATEQEIRSKRRKIQLKEKQKRKKIIQKVPTKQKQRIKVHATPKVEKGAK